MATKLFIATLLSAHFITAQCISSKKFEDIMNGIQESYNKKLAYAKTYKSPRCFAPDIRECGGTAYPDTRLELYRWYYSPVDQACRPLYMFRNEKTNCPAINDLPTTKQECEDLCGEPCTVIYASKKTEPGVYMKNEYCHIPVPKGVPHPSHTRCCPRGYLYPETTPVPTQPTTRSPIYAIILG